MAEDSFNFLVHVLRNHDVPYDRDAIKSLFDDANNQATAQAWMQKHLSPETLLTKDEAALYAFPLMPVCDALIRLRYATLLKTGEAEALIKSQDLSVIRGLDDQELQDAIVDLRRSTTAIGRQTECLRSQQNALGALIKTNTRLSETRVQTGETQRRKWKAEAGDINSAVDLEYGTERLQS